jgi:hypothetical protein
MAVTVEIKTDSRPDHQLPLVAAVEVQEREFARAIGQERPFNNVPRFRRQNQAVIVNCSFGWRRPGI